MAVSGSSSWYRSRYKRANTIFMADKKKVLIVDDDEFLLDMYAVKFRESGFEVAVAPSGGDAGDAIKNGFSPDVILLDLVMPGVDGFDFLKSLKAGKRSMNAKVIILTNLGQKEDIDKGLALGAADYIVKAHHTPSEVVEKVKALFK